MALRPESLDMLSICTGGGGIDLGIELAIPRARSVCLVEREAFAVAHLWAAMEQGLMAPAPVWSDVRTFDGRRWRGCVDGLIGGIPCQPHSLAGRKQGQLDERDLWSDARRIIVQSRCWFVLIENVGGMLSAGADEVAGAERVWRDLRKLGFTVEIGLFTAAEVGASHERERVFILGVADAIGGRWIEGHGSVPEGYRFSERNASDCGGGLSGVGLADAYSERLEGQRPDAGAVRRQDARRPSRLRDGTNLVDTEGDRWGEGWAEPSLRRGRHAIASAGDAMAHASIARSGSVSIRSRGQGEADAHFDRSSLFPPGPSDAHEWSAILERAPHLEPAVRRMADGLAAGMGSRVDSLRILGNGAVPLQAAHAFRTLCHRLAGRGSPGATRLVRMMEAAE